MTWSEAIGMLLGEHPRPLRRATDVVLRKGPETRSQRRERLTHEREKRREPDRHQRWIEAGRRASNDYSVIAWTRSGDVPAHGSTEVSLAFEYAMQWLSFSIVSTRPSELWMESVRWADTTLLHGPVLVAAICGPAFDGTIDVSLGRGDTLRFMLSNAGTSPVGYAIRLRLIDPAFHDWRPVRKLQDHKGQGCGA